MKTKNLLKGIKAKSGRKRAVFFINSYYYPHTQSQEK